MLRKPSAREAVNVLKILVDVNRISLQTRICQLNLVVTLNNILRLKGLFVLITVYDVCIILHPHGISSSALINFFFIFKVYYSDKDDRPCGPAYITRGRRLTCHLTRIWKTHCYFTALYFVCLLFLFNILSVFQYAIARVITIHFSSFLPCRDISFSSPPSPIVLFL